MKQLPAKFILILAFLGFGIFAFLLSLYIGPFEVKCNYDSEVFRYIGMVIANGGVPYRDAFDHKPPMIYFLAALVNHWDPLGHWLSEVTFLTVSAF